VSLRPRIFLLGHPLGLLLPESVSHLLAALTDGPSGMVVERRGRPTTARAEAVSKSWENGPGLSFSREIRVPSLFVPLLQAATSLSFC